MLRSATARIFAPRWKDDPHKIYGCFNAAHRKVLLYSEGYDGAAVQYFEHARLAGRFVAFSGRSRPKDPSVGSTASVLVFDLRSGRKLYDLNSEAPLPMIAGSPGPGGYPVQAVDNLVLNDRAATAWIATSDSTVEVHLRDAGGSRLLDSGSGIVAGSLRISRTTVSWTNGGAARNIAVR